MAEFGQTPADFVVSASDDEDSDEMDIQASGDSLVSSFRHMTLQTLTDTLASKSAITFTQNQDTRLSS